MNTNHTIFFTQLYYPDMTTTDIIMADLAEDLASYVPGRRCCLRAGHLSD